jgi:hypothetical protein
MRTSKNIMGIRNDRTKMSAARRRIAGAGLALAILAMAVCAPRPSYARRSSAPPVSKCSDFACEQ